MAARVGLLSVRTAEGVTVHHIAAWERTAAATLEVYRSVLAAGGRRHERDARMERGA